MSITLRKPIPHLIAFAIALSTPRLIFCQPTTVGPNNPASSINTSFSGSNFAFSGSTDVFISDGNHATAVALAILLNGQTDYLKATGFGFSIPLSATINGIKVEIEKSATGIGNILALESYVTDNRVRLIKGGVVTATDKASGTHWTSTDTYASYGSNSDLWGNTWMPADINSSNFGIAFSADVHGLASLIPVVRIDHIRITVFYTDAVLPLPAVTFNVKSNKGNTVSINWEQSTATGQNSIAVQRSPDGKSWSGVTGISGTYTRNNNTFTATDLHPLPGTSFYRLMLTSAAGAVSYTENKAITIQPATQIKVFPNPFVSYIIVSGISPSAVPALLDINGRQIPVPVKRNDDNEVRLQLEALKPGTYYLLIDGERRIIQKW